MLQQNTMFHYQVSLNAETTSTKYVINKKQGLNQKS